MRFTISLQYLAAPVSLLLDEQLERGRAISFDEYFKAKSAAAACRAKLEDLFSDADILMAHAASGEAPVGNAYTGFSFLNGVCTMLGTPCVNVPGLKGPNSMPIGLLAVGRVGDDKRTLAVANWMALRLA